MWSLLALALAVRADDVVLLRAQHGAHAHRDAIRCAGADDSGPLRIEDLVEHLMLPTALWCDTSVAAGGALCHDRTAQRALRAVSLRCDATASVRCVAEFECAPLAAELWRAAGATLACCVLLLAAARCAATARRRHRRRARHKSA